MPKLSPKHRRFVAEYLKDQNASQAAIRAGYSSKNPNVTGPRLMANVRIKAAIEAKLGKIEEDCGVTVEYVLRGFKEVAERCMQRVPVMVRDPEDGRRFVQKTDENGEGVWEFDSMGANKALECLGRFKKMFTDKVDLTSKGQSIADILTAAIAQRSGPKPS